MRIWLVNQYSVPNNLPGITRHYELASIWSENKNNEVILWLSSFLPSTRSYVKKETKVDCAKINNLIFRWLWAPSYKKNNIFRIINMLAFCIIFFFRGLVSKRPDVAVGSSPHIFLPFFVLLLTKIKRCPFVLEIRDLWPDSLIEMGGLRNKSVINILSKLESFLYRKAEKIIVLTNHQKEFIKNKGISADKIHLITNGVNLSTKVDYNEKKYRDLLGIAGDEFVAVYTGAHGPANSLESLVLAGEFLPDKYKIILIGDGCEKSRLIELKNSRNIKTVDFFDPVAKDKILNYTYAANCGIISLLNNSVFQGARPNKLFDYAFLGLPIVSTISGEIADILNKYELGICSDANDPQSIANAIIKVSELNHEELANLKYRGLQFIENEGNRQKSAKEFLEILNNVSEIRGVG